MSRSVCVFVSVLHNKTNVPLAPPIATSAHTRLHSFDRRNNSVPGCDAEAAYGWPSRLLFFQLVRRLAECFTVHRTSHARMSVLHYVVGLSFYPMASLAVLQGSSHGAHNLTKPALPSALILFVLFSAAQLHCHRTLAGFRDRRKLCKGSILCLIIRRRRFARDGEHRTYPSTFPLLRHTCNATPDDAPRYTVPK